MSEKIKVKILLLLLVVFLGVTYKTFVMNNLDASSVMIVNRVRNSGGTGIILRSSQNKSEILTNAHVCKVVQYGGVVLTHFGDFQVNSIKVSQISDLCIVTVLDDLQINTRVSAFAPHPYDKIQISGHPSLMPNIISTGHLSGMDIIAVVTDMRPCTQEDIEKNALICIVLGGMPVIKYYESILTSATIMPGSSGSGVYNWHKNLIGVVFAGRSEFGYSWIVPYEQVKHFLKVEEPTLTEVNIKQELIVNGEAKQADKLRLAKQKCAQNKNNDPKLKAICSIFKNDVIWEQN